MTTKLDDYDLGLIRGELRQPREERLRRTGIPERFWSKTWDDYEPRDATVDDLVEFLRGYGEDFDLTRGHGGRGILLQGKPGVGKTMAACLLGMQISDDGHMVRYMTLAAYMEAQISLFKLEQAWSKYDDIDAHEEWTTLREQLRVMREVAQLTVLDDVGKEHHTASDFAKDSFDLFLRTRYDLGRPVILTSNVGTDKWDQKYTAAMESFLYEAVYMVGIRDRDDMRRRRAR